MSTSTGANDEKEEGKNEKDIGHFETIILKQEPGFVADRSNSDESLSTLDATMESPIFFNKPYKIKDPIVLLERCDKIWETMQLIKNMQVSEEKPSEQVLNSEEALLKAAGNKFPLRGTTSTEPYIKYQPVLNNGNKALPNFRFSVQKMKKLFQCEACGRQFAENRSMRHHSLKVHGIFIPLKFNRKSIVKDSGDKNKTETVDEVKEEAGDKVKKNTMKKGPEDFKDRDERKFFPIVNDKTSPRAKVSDYSSRNNNNNIVGSSTEPAAKATVEEGRSLERKKKPEIKHTQGVDHSVAVMKCPLCERDVKHIRRHIIEYHKVNTPEIFIKGLQSEVPEKSSSVEQKDKIPERLSDKSQAQSWSEGSSEADNKSKAQSCVEQEDTSRDRKRRNSSMILTTAVKRSKSNNWPSLESLDKSDTAKDPVERVLCEICLGTYTRGSIKKHLLIHRSRGETKDNYTGLNCRYLNSPIYLMKLQQRESNSTNDDASEKSETEGQVSKYREIAEARKKITRASRKYDEQLETVCQCGRNFRNPHTLFIHKRTCKLKDEEDLQLQNSSDRDSGIGISITIKKKNDSYEIVGKDSGDENRSKGSGHLTDGELSSDGSDVVFNNCSDRNANTESSKYSKDHSVIVVKSIDEDVNVDIEEDSMNSCSSEIVLNKLSADKQDTKVELRRRVNKRFEPENPSTKDGQSGEKVETEKSTKTSETYYRKIPSLRVLCREALGEKDLMEESKIHKCKVCQHVCADEKELQKHTSGCSKSTEETCICGRTFVNAKSLKLHAKKVHQALLSCAFCKKNLDDIREYIDHHCDVEGTEYSESQEEIVCPYCDDILINSNKFDEHIKFHHFDQTLPYQCYKCLKRFPNRPQRLLHFRKEHTVESFCDLCKKKISSVMILKHESYHKGVGFPCHPCKKSYATKVSLLRHVMLSHSDTKNNSVMCTICKKSIRLKAFKRHLNIHTPFMTCVLCDKSFYDELQLEDHIMKIHKEKYPRVSCRSCGMSFTTPLALQKHSQTEECHKYSENSMEEDMLCDI